LLELKMRKRDLEGKLVGGGVKKAGKRKLSKLI